MMQAVISDLSKDKLTLAVVIMFTGIGVYNEVHE